MNAPEPRPSAKPSAPGDQPADPGRPQAPRAGATKAAKATNGTGGTGGTGGGDRSDGSRSAQGRQPSGRGGPNPGRRGRSGAPGRTSSGQRASGGGRGDQRRDRPEDARTVAYRILRRIETEGAYANLALRHELDRTDLDERDRRFVTDLVYGTTRLQRACDFLVDRFLTGRIDPEVRVALRLGAYQLHFAGVPPHAAVSATVEVAPRKVRGLINAVLRRVAQSEVHWPDEGTELSYPQWLVDRLFADLGEVDAREALRHMNVPATVTVRDDRYVQDQASQWVAELVDAQVGERVADLCAAPGGKATALASTGATVVAADLRTNRVSLIASNRGRLDPEHRGRVHLVQSDASAPPFVDASFDRVLVDAPCSGLGTLRRRADARWRIDADAVTRLSELQRRLVDAAVRLVRPGGVLVYSVCTITTAETLAVDAHLATHHPDLEPLPVPAGPWRAHGRGGLLLPQDADTDGMFILRLRVPAAPVAQSG